MQILRYILVNSSRMKYIILTIGLGIGGIFTTLKKWGFQWENNFEQSIIQDKQEVILGFWEVPERLLVARNLRMAIS